MLAQLFSANLFFINTVLAGLVFFCLGWLHLDSWKATDSHRALAFRAIGFFIVSLALMIQSPNFSDPTILLLMRSLKLLGLGLLLASLTSEPLLGPPSQRKTQMLVPLGLISLVIIPPVALLSIVIGLTYMVKSSLGFEKQIKMAGVAFVLFGLSELTTISTYWTNTSIVFVSKLVADYGVVWFTHHSLLFVSTLILAVWGWGFIRFRVQAQVFLLLVSASLIIFVTITTLFTYILYRNLESDKLGHLRTDIKVLQYSLERMQTEALSVARWTAQHQQLRETIVSQNSSQLFDLVSEFQVSDSTSFINLISAQGEVIMRSEDNERVGDSLLHDPVVQVALAGRPMSSIAVVNSAVAPHLLIRAVAPVTSPQDNSVIGVVETGYIVDNAFVDGVQTVTGLQTSVFAGPIRTATTFVAPDGQSRYVGSKESNSQITSRVLEDGQDYLGATQVLNQPFYAAYSPLRDYSQQVVGMLFVGQPQLELKETAEKTFQTTFTGSVILMIFSILPAYFFSKYLTDHLTA